MLIFGTSKFFEICYWPSEVWYGQRLISQIFISSHYFLLNHFNFGRFFHMITDARSITLDLAKGFDVVTSMFEFFDKNNVIDPKDHNEVNVFSTLFVVLYLESACGLKRLQEMRISNSC